ncbi:MAG TPA: EamA family transporter [Steroidobacteraceae bacterium]|jgi:multidrug transporter EmrE-like cation transporter
MSIVTWLLILTGVGLNACAQLLLKAAVRPLAHVAHFDLAMLKQSIGVLSVSAPFWAGMGCYGLSVCVWLAALSKAPVSVAYPMLSLGYVAVAGISAIWMGESLSLTKALGIALICGGVILVSRSPV